MIYYVNAAVKRSGDGSEKRPFATISEAARLAVAGDTVLVAPGVYREYVDPKNPGTEDARIHYISQVKHGAVITGAERVQCTGTEDARIHYISQVKHGAVITGAERVQNWEHYEGDTWKAVIPNGIFNGYNPYTTRVYGDWYWAEDPVHTGDVYINEKSMYEAMTLEDVLNPTIYEPAWDQAFTLHKWYTEQGDGCTIIYGNFQGLDPNKENVEINVRRNCFYPSKEGVGFITLSGFSVKMAATQWAPPTAYQEGMIGPHWSKGWIIEDCKVSNSRCAGISLGKYLQPNNENKWCTWGYKDGTQTERDAICQAQREGWTKENIGHHIVRRCEIYNCGQVGIVGHLGGVFSIIEDNHIHNINNMHELAGAEIGGIKMHAAIDVIIRRNHIHHCTRGLWLDWQAQGTRVTQNLFHHNIPPKGVKVSNGLALGEDIFVEVSHGPTLIDNNFLLSEVAIRLSTQGLAFVHNFIAGSFDYVGKGTDNQAPKLKDARFTPYHVPHRTEIAGFMTILHGDNRFYNNVFVQQPIREDLEKISHDVKLFDEDGLVHFVCGTKPFDGYPTFEEYKARFECHLPMDNDDKERYYDHLPVWTCGNAFFNGAQPCDREKSAYIDTEHEITWELTEDGIFRTNLFEYLPKMDNPVISTEILGMAFEPEQKFENPDGTPILFQRDYFDNARGLDPYSGPLADAASEVNLLEM